jgi:hypothetical protein
MSAQEGVYRPLHREDRPGDEGKGYPERPALRLLHALAGLGARDRRRARHHGQGSQALRGADRRAIDAKERWSVSG